MNLPNILIVVLDCVRSTDFNTAGDGETDPGPLSAGLLKDSIVFPRAIAPAAWTIPSHASMLTGLYPWIHRAHAKGDIVYRGEFRLLPETLNAVGYRTTMLSGNPILNDASGLHRGFQEAVIARPWETFIRSVNLQAPRSAGSGYPKSVLRHIFRVMRGVGATGIGEEFASRYPTSLDVLNRFLFNFVEKSIRTDVASPWIEQRFRRMLDTTPKERPFFALVNFNDAHEPYLPDFTHESSLHTWLSELRVSQQMSLVTAGRRIVSSREQAILHEMYVRSIRRTEERVLTLLNLLADADRWDNTLVIITSDHGQEFYEQGHLFHGFVVSDPVARIPLLVHFPSWMKVHVDSDQWTSLVDVHATIYDLLGIDQSADQVGVSLARLSGKSRDRAVYCVSDGLLRPSFARKWTNPRRIDALDRVRVAAYRGTKKLVVVERTGAGMVYDTLSGKSENFDPVQNADLELADTYDRAEFALDAMSSRSAGTSGADEVVQRLEGWGYT